MPVQQTNASFLDTVGANRIAQAHQEHADKPVDTGNRRLPPWINEGIAKLSTAYTKKYEDDKAFVGSKGKTFFRASAIVDYPITFDGQRTKGMVTSVMIPLCDKPAKGESKAVSFSENWYEFQNWFKMMGVPACPELNDGAKIQAYYFAAMLSLADPIRFKTNPIYIVFSTREWTPPASKLKPNPEPMVFEKWHGLATPEQLTKLQTIGADGGVNEIASNQPAPNTPPPTPSPNGSHVPPPAAPPVAQSADSTDPVDVVSALLEVLNNDPACDTEESKNASDQLLQMAWAQGWTEAQTTPADWAQVADMALNPPTEGQESGSNLSTPPAVTVGSKWFFAKRDKSGEKLANKDKVPFPSVEVEVVTLDTTSGTCTVKTTKDGKDMVDIKSKKPTVVKLEWLEAPPLY